MSDSKEQLHGTITARAELDRAFARLIIEDVTSVMSKNISTVLQMMEQQHGEAMGVLGVASLDIKKLVSDVTELSVRLTTLEQRMDESQADRRSIHDAVASLRKEVRAYIAGSRRDEFERRIVALEARDDG